MEKPFEESATRDRIIRACEELLRAGGPEAASTRAICERAGITAPTLYHHFGDLGRLQEIATERAFAAAAHAKRLTGEGGALERLRRGWDAYLAFAIDEPGLFAALSRQIVMGVMPRAAMLSYEMLVTNVRALRDERGLRKDPETSAQMLWAAAHGAACLSFAGRHGFPVSPQLGAALRDAALAAVMGEV